MAIHVRIAKKLKRIFKRMEYTTNMISQVLNFPILSTRGCLLKFGDAFNDPNKGGVPAIAFGDKFIVGDQPIIDNFVREIDAAENANELPDPDKIASAKGVNISADQQPASVPPSGTTAGERNKKNYFPVIIGVLIVLGIGALVYVNRKKQ